MGKEMVLNDLKDGVSIMSIDARYIYSKQNDENGYDTSVFWNDDRNILPRKLYSGKIPYSLGLIHWFKMENTVFRRIGNKIYSNDIVNVTFNKASKTVVKDENGNVKHKPRIKVGKKGRYSLEVVEELKTDKRIDELKDELYPGFMLDGEKYVQFMRSSGKARTGAILFIKEKLLDDFMSWARMDIDYEHIPGQVDIAGLKAAESLILSEIKDIAVIKSNEILLIPDVKVPCRIAKGKASITEIDQDGMAVTHDNEEEITIYNDIFDGQSLLTHEYFPDGKSMILLRNRFFKSAAFCFDIQCWFRDNGITEIKQLNGFTLANSVEDIKLITTPNSLKFMKQKDFISFEDAVEDLERATFEYWLHETEKDGCIFGIVKNEYASGFIKGYNYQVDNSMPLSKDEVRELLRYEFARIQKAKDDNNYFVNEFIQKKAHKKSKGYEPQMYKFSDSVCELYKINPDIQHTKFFRDYKNNMLGTDYKNLLKQGRYKLENSDYCVVCSNPFEMIQHACGIRQDNWVRIHEGREAYCKYFPHDRELVATRSPHIYSGNVICLHNTYHEWFDKYMSLSDNIVVINSIGTDIMYRANGMDFDSDTLLVSSNKILVEKAHYCEENFPTPICMVQPYPKERYYCIEDFIDCDKEIANAKIGEIVDLSQLLESYYFDILCDSDINEEKKKEVLLYLRNEISKLASISGCEIDRAKREYPIDTNAELKRIRSYLAGHTKPENLLHGIIKTGNVKFTVKSVKKKYLTENLNVDAGEKSDYETIQKILRLNAENEMICSNMSISDTKEGRKRLCDNKKEINTLLKSRTRTREQVMAKPKFFKEVFPEGDTAYYEYFNCSMDYLQQIIKEEYPRKDKRDKITLVLIDFFEKPVEYRENGRLITGNDKHAKIIIELAKKYEKSRKELYANYSKANGLEYDAEMEKRNLFRNVVEEAAEVKLTRQTVYLILYKLFGSNQAIAHDGGAGQYKKTIMDILYNSHKGLLLDMFFAKKKDVDAKVS
ncbi:hypothetical protein NSB25_26795 [Acetatifactor muris]|uniref:RNA dependent RNA polymerase n=1 Tax=Acetatifactor muris TaxID=879566 RepID=A0A2K4ZPH7_9FIRM|nr:hypothetical protein [Acetatifactor muris]MCR2050842.1 hypothetical protein [Acetatifactor muris]SOY32393.1 hypothetical protein AMURIS_05152 [Acetatifactor muris]